MEMTKEVKDAIGIVSAKYKYDSATLATEVEKLMKDKNITDKEAFREWKNTHRWVSTSNEYEFRVLAATEPRTYTQKNKDGTEEQKERSSLITVVQKDGGLGLYNIGLFDEKAEKVSSFGVGDAYKGRLSLKNGGYASIIGDNVEVLKDTTIPVREEVIKSLPYLESHELDQHKGENIVFKGDIVRVLKDGIGVSIDSLTGFPIPVWLGGTGVPDGATEIKGFGRVVERNGELQIYCDVVF
jgi:hypothetical protein